ncbi:MAG: hypothetical protein ABI234_00675 [Ktedonobacteraceae bacterium]
MEEQQIQEFVHRVALDERMRFALASNPTGVSMPYDVSPRVAQILARLVPYLTFERSMNPHEEWWHA